MILGERGNFTVGEFPYLMYVDYQFPEPTAPAIATPIVFFHGGCTSGGTWSTPDGRQGWQTYFAEAGWRVHGVDWPGRGRSGFAADFATMPYERVVDAGVALLDRLGPAVLLTHSMSGPVGWQIADRVPDLVAAMVAIEPGPPGNLQEVNAPRPGESTAWAIPENEPWRYEDPEYFRNRFAAGPLFPAEAWLQVWLKEVPESARIMNQRYNRDDSALKVASPPRSAHVPKLLVTSENSPGHPLELDRATAEFMGAEHVYLPEAGLPGHGHMMMLDRDNLRIADLLLDWLARQGFGPGLTE